MSLSLLLPLGLFALAGLIVPLLIHLIRRPEQEITDFAALRWLRESARPRRHLRFDELWLLLSRLALLSLLALMLALPVLNGDWRTARHVIAVDTDVDVASAQQQMTDPKAEWRWLAIGFPKLDEATPQSAQPFASLLRELDSILAPKDRLTVLVSAKVTGLDAQRIALTHAVDWRQVAANDHASDTQQKPAKHIIAIRYGSDSSPALRYLRAAVGVWGLIGVDQWQVDDQPLATPLPENTDGLIWLDAPLPDSITSWIEKGGRALVVDDEIGQGKPVWRDEQGELLASEKQLGRGTVIHLPTPLTAEKFPSLLDADFPHRLQTLILPAALPPDRAFAAEVVPTQIDHDAAETETSLIPLIGLLAALLFLLERILATRRHAA